MIDRRLRFCFLLVAFAIACAQQLYAAADAVRWSEPQSYRLLVQVEPRQLNGRTTDEMPAELQIDFADELLRMGVSARPDIASLRVIAYDPATGEPLKNAKQAKGKKRRGLPFRWYDAAIPYDFPEFAGTVSRTNGKIIRRPHIRGGYFFDAVGDWHRGRLAWIHRQIGDRSAHYAVYFDLLPDRQGPRQVPPRGWIGDGLPRCTESGASTMGTDHCRVEVDDFNGDGLVDLIVGENYGHVLWWPNRGTRQQPEFPYSRFVMLADGQPLDAGMIAAPKVVDWDKDGNKDLLVGTEWNRILFYRNLGSDGERKLDGARVVSIDGQPLQLPVSPLVRGNSDVFRRDYYPVLETVDWDGDDDTDLLAGGYITGRIYLYTNIGLLADGTPRLRFSGPLHSSGHPLNVGHWCAAPCIADLDSDGDLDLLSGNMPMYVREGESAGVPPMLQLHENVGTRDNPLLQLRAFPAAGNLPLVRLATPRAADWDDDGDLDLVVSARDDIYLFENVGTTKQPRYRVDAGRLPSRWSSSPLAVDQFRDYNGDGQLDLVHDYTVQLKTEAPNPWNWEQPVSILPDGDFIEHPSGIGDDWFWPYLADLDRDDRLDVLFGDWHGHVWFHRNLSSPERRRFDMKGRRLQLANGSFIKVGPLGVDSESSFSALQGARTVLAMGDFNGDRLNDLIVGDTFGIIRYFRNVGTVAEAVFDEPIQVGNLGIRLLVDVTDWNQDGRPDIIAGAANGRVRVFINEGPRAGSPFAAGIDPGLPPIPQPRTLAVDLNGDGDEDVFLPSTQGSCYVERSFLNGGYATGKLIGLEHRK